MPIYEFKCPNGDITERMVRPNTHAITCPKCHQKAKKILSLCSFKLKGSGWYADGYSSTKNKNNKDPAKKSQSQERKTENGRAP
ncbi:MAG: zinc ribbon domain-containing protein [Desulfobacterales bacterium]